MQLKFPDFRGSHCKILRCCGSLVDTDKETIQAIKSAGERGWLNANSKSGNSQLVIRAGFGDLDGSGEILDSHLHIDVFAKRRSLKRPNDTKTTISDIRNSVSEFEGVQIDLDVEGHFFFEEDDYPPLVEATRSRLITGDISVVANSIAFKVDGPTPIYGINWHVLKEGVVVVVEAKVFTKISDTYLLDAFEFVEVANELYVTGRPDDE